MPIPTPHQNWPLAWLIADGPIGLKYTSLAPQTPNRTHSCPGDLARLLATTLCRMPKEYMSYVICYWYMPCAAYFEDYKTGLTLRNCTCPCMYFRCGSGSEVLNSAAVALVCINHLVIYIKDRQCRTIHRLGETTK